MDIDTFGEVQNQNDSTVQYSEKILSTVIYNNGLNPKKKNCKNNF